MQADRFASTLLPTNVQLSWKHSLKSDPEGDHMTSVPYALAISSLMYAMLMTQSEIGHAVEVVRKFMHNTGLSH